MIFSIGVFSQGSMLTMRRFLLGSLLIAAIPMAAGQAAQWPQFRGPGAAGVATDLRVPDTWSATQHVLWKTAIPGTGWSSPIVWNTTIYLTSVVRADTGEAPKPGLYFGGERPAPTDEHRWLVLAVDFASGRILWQREAHRG